MARRVDAPKKYLSSPPGLPPRIKEEFDNLVRLMPAGFYVPAHRDALIELVRIKVKVDELYERTQQSGYDPVPLDQNGKWYTHPVEGLLRAARRDYITWMRACQLTPESAYNNKTVPRVPETEVEAEKDPALSRLRGVV